MNNLDLRIITLCVLILLSCRNIWNVIREDITKLVVKKFITEVERNPKWLTEELFQSNYGFHDIDIVLCDSKLLKEALPLLHYNNKTYKYELLVRSDVSPRNADLVGKTALAAKIITGFRVNISYEALMDKPLHWLSILCYLLEGGDIKMSSVKWEDSE